MLKEAHINWRNPNSIFFGASWFEMGILGRKEEAEATAFQVKKQKIIVSINDEIIS